MGQVRSVVARVQIQEAQMGRGFSAFGLRNMPGFSLDPFLNIDDFRMSEPTFPPHPHAGFSAVTYMFEDSPGAFINRDSLGDRSRIGPGSLHWTQAAHGMMHEEIPEVRGTLCHGLQMFVNLRSDHKQAPARAFHADAADIPEVSLGEGARVRVLTGSFGGAQSPLTQLLTPVLLLDVQLQPHATVTLPVDREQNCFLLSIQGSGFVGPSAPRVELSAHQGVGFGADGDELTVAAGAHGLQVLVAAGRPIGEPVVFGGPFAMTSQSELAAAKARYQRGEMGRLEASF